MEEPISGVLTQAELSQHMRPPRNYALFYEFDLKAPRKRQVRCSATVFRPLRMPTGEWACRLLVRGIDLEDQTIYGVDSLQAFILALGCVRFLLERLKKRGVALRYRNSAEEVDLELYFQGCSR